MRYEDTKLLLEFARLQMEIVVYMHGGEARDQLTVVRTSKSKGARAHRDFVAKLSPLTRERYLAQLRRQVAATRELFERVKAEGGEMSLDSFEIVVRDADSGDVISTDPKQCRSSGAGLPSIEIDGNNLPYVKCPSCYRRWPAHDIGFKIPNHEPEET